jgi:2-polyprenyl-6-methoxyphenol hydroxylase-like FAD-dependent oxidoreductase
MANLVSWVYRAGMDMTNDNPRRALVVGLGISGIATAVRLRSIGWQPVLIEKAPARRSSGYFVGVFGAGKAAAARMGILDGMVNRTPPNAVTYYIDRAGHRDSGLGFLDLPGTPRMLLRGDIEQAAFAALPEDVEIRYSTVPSRIEQDARGVEVMLANTATGTETVERFDLVVGADGMRSTVRRLSFGPAEDYLHRMNHMIAAFELRRQVDGFGDAEGVRLVEPGRSMWVFPFLDHAPTVLLAYHTDDVDAEFRQPRIERIRAVYGPEPLGKTLGEVLAELESADEVLFDSVEQVKMSSWHNGRVVLVGDSAWCTTLYAGMGASLALAGADLLGTMLQRHPHDLQGALAGWEQRLRPYVDYCQHLAEVQRPFFTPSHRCHIAQRKMVERVRRLPLAGRLLTHLQSNGRAQRMKDMDVAAA